jgi:RHS repeat-associated protein
MVSEAFGKTFVDTTLAPTTTGTTTNNFRFPGQYEDQETGTYYNYMRTYLPMVGRYGESDPIGLYAGLNTYTYVEGNPLSYTDPEGLWVNIAAGAAIGGLGNLGYQLWNNGGKFKCVDWGDVAKWTAAGALAGVLVPEGLIVRGGMQTVTRWGPSGNWVMTGGNSWRNWWMGGVPQLGHSMSTAVTTQVPTSSLAWPAGWEAVKGLIGQRVLVGGATIGGAGAANAATGSSDSCECKR